MKVDQEKKRRMHTRKRKNLLMTPLKVGVSVRIKENNSKPKKGGRKRRILSTTREAHS